MSTLTMLYSLLDKRLSSSHYANRNITIAWQMHCTQLMTHVIQLYPGTFETSGHDAQKTQISVIGYVVVMSDNLE